ncbi:MAG TPA: DNA primase [Sulfuricurvum sp.]|nr:MAG: DNA primase [Campylobacterales bacterium 16-40-21]OZA03195.1 MAG: DNA primase [Sulfuricurvum sp. 17-40-25]HQS66997.1 DNA primase [Sulfuricurvum sp.]HQT37500.1 DNA primase [Sulfuricurvum sp.]
MITTDSIEGLKARLDIVDIVGSYIELKRAGANFKAPCPFHDEKSPSFTVNPSRQKYHCFGCGVGGDSISFVMEYEKLNYPEAIEKLASSVNYSLQYTDNNERRERSNLLEQLSGWYQKLLDEHTTAKTYLTDRGIFASSIERFGIGYAPVSAQTLEFLKQHRYSVKESVEQGAIGSDGGREFARFIERITFPIHAPNGSIVGFGGRTITGHQAKYVNSSQSAIFNKSRLLYAYPLARESIYKHREVIVTEGYLDVVMLHQAGFTQSVATLGTALTAEHLPLLRKGEPRVLVAYDGDKPGRAAALKASKLLSMGGFEGGVILFEGGKDPADMIKEGLVTQLNALLHHPVAFIEFVISEICSGYDLRDPRVKENALNECLGYIKTLSPLMQEEYRPFIASQIGISPSLIRLAHTSSTKTALQAPQLSHHDMWELSLIKTILERPQITDGLLDYLDASLLQYHPNEFAAAIGKNSDDPQLMAITMDDRIHSFDGDEGLRAELMTFLSAHYNRELKKLASENSLSFDQKSYAIRQIREKIARLKRGELVPLS